MEKEYIDIMCKNHHGSRPFFEKGEFKTLIDLDRIIMIQQRDWPEENCVHIYVKTSEVDSKVLYSMQPYEDFKNIIKNTAE